MTLRFPRHARLALGVLALFVAMALGLANQGKALAATTAYSITLTPTSTQLTVPPGGSTSSSFTVVNDGTTNYNMTDSVAPYRVVGENYDPFFTLLPGKTDASQWVHLSGPSSQSLDAGKSQTTSFTLNVPAGTAPGGYYAVAFAEANPPAGNGVTSLNRVGDILYITVEGPVQKTGDLKAPSLPYIVFGKHLNLGLLVQDTGGLHFITNANITATSLFGHQAFSASLERYILPQTERLVTAPWKPLPAFGIYKISRSATVFGKVQTLSNHWVVIIQPWILVFIITGLILVVVFIILLVKSRKPAKPTAGGTKRKPSVRP